MSSAGVAPTRGAERQAGPRLRALAELSHLLAREPEPKIVFDAALSAAARLLGADDVLLWLHDPEADVLRPAARAPFDVIPSDLTIPADETPIRAALREGMPLLLGRTPDHPVWRHVVGGPGRPGSALFVPCVQCERPLGALLALSEREDAFGDEDVDFTRTLMAQIGVAIRHDRLSRETARQAGQFATILDVNKRLALGPELGQILARITEEAARLVAGEAAALRLVEGEDLVRVARFGFGQGQASPERLAVEPGSGNAVILSEGRSVVSNDFPSDSRFDADVRAGARALGFTSWLGVPLRGRGGSIGILSVLGRGERPFADADARLLEAFADQAAIAIENARLLAMAERRVAEATAVAEVGRALARSREPGEILELIVAQACRLLRTERAAVGLLEPEDGRSAYRFVAHHGLSDRFPRHMRPRHRRDGTTPMAIAERRPVWTADVLEDPTFDLAPETRAAIVAEGYRAVLSVPLLATADALGALVVYRDMPGPFSQEEVDLLRVFADHAAIAIEHARLFQQEQARRRQLEAIRDVTAEITRELDLTTLLDLIWRRAAELVGAASGVVYLWDEAEQVLVPRAWHGLGEWVAGLRLGPGEAVAGVAAERRTGMIVNHYRDQPYVPRLLLKQSAITASLAQPLLYGDRLVGMITVNHEDTARTFGEQDRELLELFAAQAAVAIENARLYEQAAKVEALGELSRLKAEFLNTVSHELRTPLSLIHGYAELLIHRAPELPPRQVTEMAGEIHAGSRTMVRLVDDLLDFSRMEQDRLSLERRPVTLATVFGPLVATFRQQPGGERIVTNLPDALVVHADPERLAQVVGNLLTNALRYAPNGPIVVRAEGRDGWLRVEVADRGPGIPPDEQARVWEKFYRGSASMTSSTRGSGIGLAVVRHLVELHGGRVGLRSARGRGSTFWFVVPLDPRSTDPGG